MISAYNIALTALFSFALLGCRTKQFNDRGAASSLLEVDASAGESIQGLLTENSPRSRQRISEYLIDFTRELDTVSTQENPSSEPEFLKVSAQIMILALSDPNKALCDENEKMTFYRGLPGFSLSSFNPSEAVIVARGFRKTDQSFAQVMRKYAQTVTDPANFGNRSPSAGSNQIEAVAPFSYSATSSRHSLAVAPADSPYISVSVSPAMARSFAKDGSFVVTLKMCPARLWSTAEGGFAAEGEFLIPFGTLPGEITRIDKVSEGSSATIDSLPQSSIAKCFFENPGIGDTGIFKSTSVQILNEFNQSILQAASTGASDLQTFASVDFSQKMDSFVKKKCNCAHQVKVFQNLAAKVNRDNQGLGLPATWTPDSSFCSEFFAE